MLNQTFQWDDALCISNQKIFFSEKDEEVYTAVLLCRRCPHALECREQGQSEKYGVWGGMIKHTNSKTRKRLEKHVQDQDLLLGLGDVVGF